MDILIKIGRSVEGPQTIRVPSTYEYVGREHAFVQWLDGIVTIEDNHSTNGTFVNGQRVSKANITENDTVWLGGNGTDNRCFKLDLKRLFASFPKPSQPQQGIGTNEGVKAPKDTHRTDYTKEFAPLKKTSIKYHAELSELKKKSTMKMQMPRVLLSMIPAVLGLVILLVSRDMTVRIVAMSAGSVLSGLIGTLTMGKSSTRQEEMTEKILDLQLKYENEYKCPKCGKKYSLDLHWKKLQADGKCPFGCGARFVE